MNTKGYGNIPSPLYECITFIGQALAVSLVPTFIELLVGAMIAQAGFVIEVWLAINPLHRLNAYYDCLPWQKFSASTRNTTARFKVTCFPQPILFIIFADTFIYRFSKKASGSAIHHDDE